MSSLLRSVVTLGLVSGLLVVTACGDDPPATVLQPLDFAKPEGEAGPFDRNSIINSLAFT
ncbi:MAG: hypothetical protein K0S65_3576, partial [Labilithrix sp.]|nr:hypothetical protein [Labilithrix sp.]